MAMIIGRSGTTAVKRALRQLREAGVVERRRMWQSGHTQTVIGHYRVDTVDPALAAEREERERRELVESVPPVRRRAKPTIDDPFVSDPSGPFAREHHDRD